MCAGLRSGPTLRVACAWAWSELAPLGVCNGQLWPRLPVASMPTFRPSSGQPTPKSVEAARQQPEPGAGRPVARH